MAASENVRRKPQVETRMGRELREARLWTAMVTPFDPHDPEKSVDYDRAGELAHYLIEKQASQALVVAGTTGEKPTLFDAEELGDEEKIGLFRAVLDAVGGKAPIVLNVGTNATNHTLWFLGKVLDQFGDQIDGVMAVVPYYNKPPQCGIERHMNAICDLAEIIPVVFYTVPGRTVVDASVDTICRVAAKNPNMLYVKEASGDIAKIGRLHERLFEVNPRVRILSGDDGLVYPLMTSLFVHGVISVASHVAGSQMLRMMEFVEMDRVAEAYEIYQQLDPVFKAMFCCGSPAPVKYAMELQGFPAGGCRLPMVSLPEIDEAEGTGHCQTVEDALKRAKLL